MGAFKLRGGLVYFHHLAHQGERPAGVISATRGNHGQSVAFSASRYGIQPIIVVPHGNSRENAAMRSLGAELIEHGEDFQASREYAAERARHEGLHLIPAFHPGWWPGSPATAWSCSPRWPTLTKSTCRSVWVRASAA